MKEHSITPFIKGFSSLGNAVKVRSTPMSIVTVGRRHKETEFAEACSWR